MADLPSTLPTDRSIWMRGLLMILMALAFQLACTVLGLLALVQFVLAAASDGASPRLKEFGQQLGQYVRQIAEFVSFATEDAPFPFSDWPAMPR
jgi:hypothetical protein